MEHVVTLEYQYTFGMVGMFEPFETVAIVSKGIKVIYHSNNFNTILKPLRYAKSITLGAYLGKVRVIEIEGNCMCSRAFETLETFRHVLWQLCIF